VARQLLDTVRSHGATTVFGLPGVHNLAFWRTDRTPVVVRHEQAAVYAADGWARSTGRLGAAVVTTGPGAANAVAAFGEAAASRSPVLLVASEIPQALRREGRLRGVLHESRDQAALFAPLAKAVFTPRTAQEVAAAVGAAVATALRAPRGPVYLDVPADVLGAEAAAPARAGSDPEPEPDPAALDAAAAHLAGARVVIWTGGGALDAAAAVAGLAERLGAPVVSSYAGRGCPSGDHPCAVGLPPHEPEVADLIGAADVLLAVGGDLDGMNTRNWTMPRPPRLVTVDAAPAPDPPEWPADAAVTGALDAALRGLAARVPAAPAWAPRGLRAAVLARLRADPATAEAVALLDAVDTARTVDTVLVCDMAVAGYWVGGYAAAPAPRRVAYPVGWGTLGFGLPAALGAAAAGRPVLAVCGDGGLMMALGELATLVQERLPVTVLVVDDGGYGMLRYDQARAGDPAAGVDLVTPDLVALAASFGLPATGVAGVAELGPALVAAVRSGAPHLVRVPARLTPPRTTSPRWHEG
jgi:thiamine pyrophosphate-dependent acetolactate synthase large subunit-like protein